MVVGSFKELLNLIILYQMMYITDWSKYSLGCMNNYYSIQNIKLTTFFRVSENLLETKCLSMFHIILGFKNEDKIYFVILVVYSYFRKTKQTAIKIVNFE